MDQETILIIDDEFVVRESLAASFDDEGYKVITATDGESGLNLFFKERVDVVITDIKMPRKSGIEVMEEIRSHNPDIPVIAISGFGNQKNTIAALRMGAKDFITKPIKDLDMIHHVIKKALETKYLIEENRRYRIRLEKSEARYRTITEQVIEGVFTVDEQENMTFTNPAFCRMLGHPPNGLLNKNLKQMTTQQGFKTILKQTDIRKTGKNSRYEIQMLDCNNAVVHVELACSPLFDDDNQYMGAIVVARDITTLIRLREKYQKFIKSHPEKEKDMQILCANCKQIKHNKKGWMQMEDFFTDILFSHGICPTCCDKLYPDFDFSNIEDD